MKNMLNKHIQFNSNTIINKALANNLTGDHYSSKTRQLDNNSCKNPCQINRKYSPRDRVEYLWNWQIMVKYGEYKASRVELLNFYTKNCINTSYNLPNNSKTVELLEFDPSILWLDYYST